jgi:single-stranded-DNA-specific exonuclease
VDGLAASVIATRCFERLECEVWTYIVKKGENAWSPSMLDQVTAWRAQAMVVVDLGSRSDRLLDIPTLLIDHHKPTGVPDGATLISGYGWDPTPSSGLLAYWCAESVGVEQGLGWLAAASMLADYGSTSAFPETKAAVKAVGSKTLRKVTTLLNVPRRTAAGDANPTLQMLLRAPNAASVLQPPNEELLLAAKAEVDTVLQRARKVAPRFAGDIALISVNEECQVHPLVAQTWRNRLPKQIVMCANFGYLPGRVNFAVRTARADNLIDLLQKHRPAGAGDDYGRGHDKATGGSLTVDQWDDFIASFGFKLQHSPA